MLVIEEADGRSAVAARQLLVDVARRRRVKRCLAQIEEADSELRRERLGKVQLREASIVDEELSETLVRVLLALQGSLDLLLRDETHLLEDVAKPELRRSLATHDVLEHVGRGYPAGILA